MPRGLVAFGLGVLSFPLFFFLGEGFGVPVMVPGMAAYFFFCQFMLSRGRVNGFREWPIMLALDAIPMLLLLMAVIAVRGGGRGYQNGGPPFANGSPRLSPLQRSFQNGPRRQGFASPRQTSARP